MDISYLKKGIPTFFCCVYMTNPTNIVFIFFCVECRGLLYLYLSYQKILISIFLLNPLLWKVFFKGCVSSLSASDFFHMTGSFLLTGQDLSQSSCGVKGDCAMVTWGDNRGSSDKTNWNIKKEIKESGISVFFRSCRWKWMATWARRGHSTKLLPLLSGYLLC